MAEEISLTLLSCSFDPSTHFSRKTILEKGDEESQLTSGEAVEACSCAAHRLKAHYAALKWPPRLITVNQICS